MNPLVPKRRVPRSAWRSGLLLLALPFFVLGRPADAQPLQIRDSLDHLATGFPLTGSHERVPCESCHVGGVFRGTPRECGTCHSGGGIWQATRKSPNHIPSSERCGDCHLTTTWAVARFDHSQVMGDCSSCHNGAIAEGKHAHHVPSPDDCQLCHGTMSWVPARFDHAGIVSGCFACHNGTFAEGKPSDHIPSSNDCEGCHDTRSWGTGVGFDHAGITDGCGGCHNGTTATGTPAGHFVTSLECNACHGTVGWMPVRFSHSSPSYPGDHAGRLGCQDCHLGNSEALPWRFAAYQPDCAACHADDFRPDPHRKSENPEIRYTVSELRDCTGACHVYTDATFSVIQRARSGEHRVTRGEW